MWKLLRDRANDVQAQQKPRPAATKPKVPPMPVQARTQEEAAAKAKEAYSAQPKASAKTGRSFFERLKPEKVIVTHYICKHSVRMLKVACFTDIF